MSVLIVVAAALALLVFWAVAAYNRFVNLRNRFKNAFAQIDVQLKRRHDLIPNLVETARAYMQHERQTLEAVIAARNQAVGASAQAAKNPADMAAMQKLAAAEGGLSAMLGKLFALSEAYPELKANQNMLQLTEELSSTENRIAFSRQAYNDGITEYNTALQVFPASLIAGLCAFAPAQLLESTETPQQRQPVKVSF